MTDRRDSEKDELNKILSSKGPDGPSIADLVGQVIKLESFVLEEGQYGTYAQIVYSLEGKVLEVRTGAVAIVGKLKKLEDGGFLPTDVRVTDYKGQFGNPGYDFSPPDEAWT